MTKKPNKQKQKTILILVKMLLHIPCLHGLNSLTRCLWRTSLFMIREVWEKKWSWINGKDVLKSRSMEHRVIVLRCHKLWRHIILSPGCHELWRRFEIPPQWNVVWLSWGVTNCEDILVRGVTNSEDILKSASVECRVVIFCHIWCHIPQGQI